MRPPDEPTATDRHKPSDEPSSLPLVWKLRVVYTGGECIVRSESVSVRGTSPVALGRGTPTIAASRRILVDDPKVSREHAQVRLDGSQLVAVDLGSKNGSSVNGRRLVSREPRILTDGDVLRLGDSFVIVRHEAAAVPDAEIPSLVGVSLAARSLRSAIARCAIADCMVLLLGETGTGKGAAASAIHGLSQRSGQLVAVNCAAVPTTLAEGAFFGVKPGAYTGAVERAGYFMEANDGTLLLDEVGEMPLDMQPKLLQAIETQAAKPVGGARPVPCNARIVAATNRDLQAAMRAGTFREDLYHRLSAVVIRLPSLRERREDILLLAAHLAGDSFRPSPSLVAAMLRYAWPGNVREVANIVKSVRYGDESDVIARLSSPSAEPGAGGTERGTVPSRRWQSGDPPPTREEIIALLRQYGSLNRIDKEIGYSRRQFKRWMDGYGIELAAQSQEAE